MEEKRKPDSGGSSSLENQQEVTAPSVGPNTVIEKEPPEERLGRHEQSSTDAMGLDKRREVVGQSYGPSIARQITIYGVFVAVTVALAIGFILLAGKLDEAPDSYPDLAPWSEPDAKQTPPKPLE
jgi:hypothetical protein